MPGIKISCIFLVTLFFIAGLRSACAQNPVITPKAGPIILKLDASGNHTININELTSSITNATSVNITPQALSCADLGQQTIHVFAENNNALIRFDRPVALTHDAAGNIYIIDQGHYLIKRLRTDGTLEVLAGSGSPGNVNGTGSAASFGECQGIVCDADGNVYVTDYQYNTIRKITPAGVTSNFVSDNGRGAADGPLAEAKFSRPWGITIDQAGNFYVADNSLIRKISTAGIVTTIAGVSFTDVTDVAIDAAGNIYATDYGANRITKIAANGVVSNFAGNGTPGSADGLGAAASFYSPMSIEIEANGNLLVADSYNNRIRRITPAGLVTTIAGDGENDSVDGIGILAKFSKPQGITTTPSGLIYIVDHDSGKIRKISAGNVVTSLFSNDGDASDNKDIEVIVASTPVFAVMNTQQVIANNTCQGIMPDYVAMAQNTVTNACITPLTITQSPSAGSTISGSAPIVVTLTAKDNWGGTATTTFNVQLVSDQAEQPHVIVAPDVNDVCPGTNITFTATPQNNVAITTYQWLLNNVNVGTNSPVYASTDLKNGDKVSVAVSGGEGCVVPVLSNESTVTIKELPVITFANNEVILPGGNVQLSPQISGDVLSYSWLPTAGLSNPNVQNPIASPVENTTYQLHVVSVGGCDVYANVTVNIITKIPNAFTPNGDGINDYWKLPFLAGQDGCVVDVFTRYGSAVYHSIGYGKPWDGNKGGSLSAGVYYYIIRLKNNSTPLTGYVSVIR
ncbi:T9SS type B sorting domain-containing protein [Mucilaginibacter terrigena]|uniref:T9SS type B sorting domain-containing protein n=1 Tax=Mucilaginibacter terrigena TaxID=2492395 RepID=A0A4Q5LRJ4_9SPHI|nr:gliding motility-associated C-terminal domain-containing protein [Mucilaginibacter terrigena]RYU92131.1 T9SS type B sorting domain-containing protein [Mucilaginibacter terrigena]